MESLCERCSQPVGKGERLCKECAAKLVPRKPKTVSKPTLPELPDLPSLESVPPSAGESKGASGGEPGAPDGGEADPFASALDMEEDFSPEDMSGISAEELDAMEEAAGEKPRRTMQLVQPGQENAAEAGPDEVDLVAGYGATPDSIAVAIPYALRVWRRRRELAKTLAGLEQERAAAEIGVNDSLAGLGSALQARRAEPALASLQKLFLTVKEADGKIEQHAGDRVKNRENAEARMKELQAGLEAAEREAEPFREKENEVKTRLAEAEKKRDRARAMLQRVQIEKRALEGATEPPGQDRIDSLNAAEQARQSEVEVAGARVAEVSKELSQASLELAEKMKAVSAALAAQQQAVDALEQDERDFENRALQAEGEKRAAFIAVAEAALEQRLAPTAEANAVRDARDRLAEVEHGQQVHREALDRYDADRYKQGIFTAAALAAIVLALIVVLIIL